MPVKHFLFGLGSGKRFATLVAVVALAAGCGDDGGDDAAAAGSPGSGGGGTTISITGTPPSQVMVGTPLDFTPTVNNPGGVALSFTASNLPGWVAINGSTGQVTGTPGAADVGTYSNIRVTVSGGGQSVTSPAYSISVVSAASGSAQLSWIPPTQRTDGSALTNLAGYRVHYGTAAGSYTHSVQIPNKSITSVVIEDLTATRWYFAVKAYNTSGVESAFSASVNKLIQ